MQFRHGPFDILWMKGGLGFLFGQIIFFARFADQNFFSNILYDHATTQASVHESGCLENICYGVEPQINKKDRLALTIITYTLIGLACSLFAGPCKKGKVKNFFFKKIPAPPPSKIKWSVP
jgi:hypothetical protein